VGHGWGSRRHMFTCRYKGVTEVKLRAQSEPWWTISRQKVVSPVKSDAGCVCEVDDFGGSLEFRRAGREGKRGTWRKECHRAAFGAVCRPPAELMYRCSLSTLWYMHPRIAGVVLRKPRMKQAREQKVVEGQVTFGRVNRGRSWTPDSQCRRSCAGSLHKQAPLFFSRRPRFRSSMCPIPSSDMPMPHGCPRLAEF
jgi:hypothetical protein